LDDPGQGLPTLKKLVWGVYVPEVATSTVRCDSALCWDGGGKGEKQKLKTIVVERGKKGIVQGRSGLGQRKLGGLKRGSRGEWEGGPGWPMEDSRGRRKGSYNNRPDENTTTGKGIVWNHSFEATGERENGEQ